MLNFFRQLLRGTPLVGGLFDVKGRDHWEALVELVPSLLLSTIPISLGTMLISFSGRDDTGWYGVFIENISRGELCIYAIAMLGPLYYFIFKEYKDAPTFPSSRSIIVISSIILIISVAIFVFIRSNDIFGRDRFDKDLIFNVSLGVFIASVIIVYLSHVYKNYVEGAANISGKGTKDFVKEYMEHRGGGDE